MSTLNAGIPATPTPYAAIAHCLCKLTARLTAENAAWVLNCQPLDMPALIAVRLLKPLANPAANSIKFFAAADLLKQIKDRNWLARVTATINHHWQAKNARKNETATDTEVAEDAHLDTPDT